MPYCSRLSNSLPVMRMPVCQTVTRALWQPMPRGHLDVGAGREVVGAEAAERAGLAHEVDLDGFGDVPAAGVDEAEEAARLDPDRLAAVDLDRVVSGDVTDFDVADRDAFGVAEAHAHAGVGQAGGGGLHLPPAALDEDVAVPGVAAVGLVAVSVEEHGVVLGAHEHRARQQRQARVAVDP
jgi:hypothetical protein